METKHVHISQKHQAETTCYHCSNTCELEVVVHQEKSFCCTGCRSVFQILKEANLCDYYSIEAHAGVFTTEVEKGKFDYLEDANTLAKLVDFQNDSTISVTFRVPQIHCYSCLWLLEHFHHLHNGIVLSEVNYMKKELSLSFLKSKTTLKEVVIKLASIGYEPQIEPKGTQNTSDLKNKRLLTQIGVAGFGFGNIMFMSFPEYFTGGEGIPTDLYQYFGWVSLLLATLVVVISAKDYLSSALLSVRHGRVNLDVPISLGILTIYVYSCFEIFVWGGFGYLDSLSGLVFFLLLGKLFQSKTFDQFNFERDYTSYFPLSVQKLDSKGNQTTLPVGHLKIGDTILVRSQEIIPADGVLLSGTASIDYSFVTGESLPETQSQNALLYAGGKVKGAAIEVLISSIPSQSYLTKLWNQTSTDGHSKIHVLSDKVAKYFTLAVLLIAFGAGAYWFVQDAQLGIKVFASILIIACPCALALAIPLSYGNALRILGGRGFYLKNTHVVEHLSSIDILIFDKTGTLTTKSGEVTLHGKLSLTEQQVFTALLKNSMHPLCAPILEYMGGAEPVQLSHYQEAAGQGIQATHQGQVFRAGSAEWVSGPVGDQRSAQVHLSVQGNYRGYFQVQNKYRSGLASMFDALKVHWQLMVLSGDNPSEEHRLKSLFGIENLWFLQTPHSKKQKVEELQNTHQKVMMIGDGLNDAGALLAADVGVAITDSSVGFTPASDVILSATHLHQLDQFLAFCKAARWVVFACFGVSLLYNFVGLYFAVRGELSPLISAILMPISSVSVLFLSLGLSQYAEHKVFNDPPQNPTSNQLT